MTLQEHRLAVSPASRALAEHTDPEPIVADIVASILDEYWAVHVHDQVLMSALQARVMDNVISILALISGRLDLDEVPPPSNFAFVDRAVELGIPMIEVEASYWIALRVFWRHWFESAGEAATREEGPFGELVGAPTETLMQHVRVAVKTATARYEAISESTSYSSNDRRRMLIAAVVDGEPAFPLDDIEQELGYRFAGTHLALALTAAERCRVEPLITNLAERLGAAGSLSVLHGADTWVTWLRFAGPLGADVREALPVALSDPRVAVTAGEPGIGLGGFRRTRGDALAAAGLRRRFDGFEQFLWFRDVSLELCLLADEQAARRFMADELGDLNASGDREERARQTLLAWLSCGSSSVVAARSFLHENTVRMRVAQAQEMLPTDLSGRRAEVTAALRLRALLGDPA